MRITVKLGGPLRKRVSGLVAGEKIVELPQGARVSDVLRELGLDGDVVRVLMLNHRPIAEDRELADGDRLGMFPRELAYNTMTAISFFNPLARDAQKKP